MATTDATPIPVKNQAYRVTFPILDADGDLVTAATALDSEVSKDAGTFVDCTNEATEIATGSGMYYLDLTATEMNADTVAIIVKTTTSGAKTTPMVLYPNKTGGLSVNVTSWAGNATATTNVALKNTLAKTTDITGFNDISQANVQTELTTYGALKPTVAARTLDVSTGGEAGVDWANIGAPTTAQNLSATTISTSQAVASVSGSVGSVTGAVGSVAGAVTVGTNNDKTGYSLTSAYDPAKTAMQAGASVTVATNNDKVGYSLTSAYDPAKTAAQVGSAMTLTTGGVDSIWAKAMTELSSVPGVTASTLSALQWVFLLARNKITQSATTQVLRNDADSATIGSSTVSDDGTTFTRGEFA